MQKQLTTLNTMSKTKTYTVAVRGNKLEGTPNVSITVTAENVQQAEGVLHSFLWKGSHLSKQQTSELVKKHVQDFASIEHLHGCYALPRVKAIKA